MNIVEKKITEIKPYEKNPRKNDGAVDAVAKSIQEFGFKVPIVIDKDNVIVCGHTRYKASKKLGIKEVPCVVADDLTEDQIKAFRLVDNRTSELAEWDLDLLSAEIEDIDMNLDDFNFQLEDIGEKDIEQIVEDTPPEVDEENPPQTKRGDIYILGNHRLMCGDSTSEEDVSKLMDGQQADLYLTDPPYNVAYDGNKNEDTQNEFNHGDNRKIKNDIMSNSDFIQFLSDAFSSANYFMKSGCPFYIWHSQKEQYNILKSCVDTGWEVRQCIIWNKNKIVFGRQDYQWKHEPCLYGWKEGSSHYFVDDRTQQTVIEDKIDLNTMNKEQLKILCKELLQPKISTTIIDEDRANRNELHPTMKPVRLFSRLILNSSRKGEIVLDSFGGSGTTMIACEQLGRRCFTMELDEKYCDVIVKRWETLTGKKAVKQC